MSHPQSDFAYPYNRARLSAMLDWNTEELSADQLSERSGSVQGAQVVSEPDGSSNICLSQDAFLRMAYEDCTYDRDFRGYPAYRLLLSDEPLNERNEAIDLYLQGMAHLHERNAWQADIGSLQGAANACFLEAARKGHLLSQDKLLTYTTFHMLSSLPCSIDLGKDEMTGWLQAIDDRDDRRMRLDPYLCNNLAILKWTDTNGVLWSHYRRSLFSRRLAPTVSIAGISMSLDSIPRTHLAQLLDMLVDAYAFVLGGQMRSLRRGEVHSTGVVPLSGTFFCAVDASASGRISVHLNSYPAGNVRATFGWEPEEGQTEIVQLIHDLQSALYDPKIGHNIYPTFEDVALLVTDPIPEKDSPQSLESILESVTES